MPPLAPNRPEGQVVEPPQRSLLHEGPLGDGCTGRFYGLTLTRHRRAGCLLRAEGDGDPGEHTAGTGVQRCCRPRHLSTTSGPRGSY
jgi:hypothetical protein